MGAEAFQERIDKAENSFMYEISVIEKKYDRTDPAESTEFERETAKRLVLFKERLERENYIRAVCTRFNIQQEGMKELVASIGSMGGIIKKSPDSTPSANAASKKKKESGVRQAEKILLTWMIDDLKVFEKVKAYVEPQDFIDPLLRDVAAKLYEQSENGNVNPALIISTYETEEAHNEVAALFSAELAKNLNKSEREKALNDAVIKVKGNSIKHAIECTKDPKQLQELITKQIKLSNIRIEL